VRTKYGNWFLKQEQKKSENWVRFSQVTVSGFSCHQKLVQASNEKEVMNIKLNYISMQNGTIFSLLDLVNHSWIMGV
jgi:hypothetical protein